MLSSFLFSPLHTGFVDSEVLKTPGTLSTGGLTITIPSLLPNNAPEASQVAIPAAYCHVKKALKHVLHTEIELFNTKGCTASIAPLVNQAGGSTKTLAMEFMPQLMAYSHKEYSFADPLGSKLVLQWWRELLPHPKGCVIAVSSPKFPHTAV
jgi:hypothetical protein